MHSTKDAQARMLNDPEDIVQAFKEYIMGQLEWDLRLEGFDDYFRSVPIHLHCSPRPLNPKALQVLRLCVPCTSEAREEEEEEGRGGSALRGKPSKGTKNSQEWALRIGSRPDSCGWQHDHKAGEIPEPVS